MAPAQLDTVLQHLRKLFGTGNVADVTDAHLLQRFAAERDEAAFAALVQRHGRLVWSVCQQVLHHEHDAEDAFQATFLVLARRAASIHRGEAVASWLYRVAYRIALKAGAARAKRQALERQALTMPQGEPFSDVALRELQALLQDELGRLPEKFRAPFVLCCLEGHTKTEAARLLGWKEGTVSGRLSVARKRLQVRLERRGVTLAALLSASALSVNATAVPASLVQAAVRAAVAFAAGQAIVAGEISTSVVALAEGVTHAMFLTKLKIATVCLLALSLATGASVLTHQALAEKQNAASVPTPPTQQAPAQKTAAPQDEAGDTLTFSGRVLDPDGKPFTGATVYLTSKRENPSASKGILPKLLQVLDPSVFPPLTLSGADGSFRLAVSKAHLQAPYHEDVELIGRAPGYGFAWHWFTQPNTFTDVNLRLTKDVPIEGRIITLEGKPIAGVQVKMGSVCTGPDGTLKAWFDLVEAALQQDSAKSNEWLRIILKRQTPFPVSVTTDADGRFRISGVGAERVIYMMEFSSPVISRDFFAVVTRPGPGIKTDRAPEGFPYYLRTYGPTFTHVVNTSQSIVGTVRDKATGKPLAGVQVASHQQVIVNAFTDKDGKYQLIGVPQTKERYTNTWPWIGSKIPLPYLATFKHVGDRGGPGPRTVDFDLVRGVVLRGRIIDKVTGKPVADAQVTYATFKDNPHLASFAFDGNPAFAGPDFFDAPQLGPLNERCGADGTFSIVVLPGRGVIGARVWNGAYQTADLEEARKDPDFWFKMEPHLGTSSAEFQALKLIEVPEKAESATCDLTVIPGTTLKGTVYSPDGRSLKGVRVTGRTAQDLYSGQLLPTAEFTVVGLDRHLPRMLGFYHPGQQLGAIVLVRAEDKGPLTVRLQKCGTLTGRLLNEQQDPRSGIRLWGLVAEGLSSKAQGRGYDLSAIADTQGRFRVEGLVPGVTYTVSTFEGEANGDGKLVARGVKVAAGETKDLGDVVTKPPQ
jgi:RNA polymerase sigma factor (sigma-70 family)